ncbi:hypothetical protein [Chitinimonas sp. BJYL2]|uniref:hypothetical protein n=1 Tax=Chitinimonas sp. BJYL2 TaxID=2976696 RepID=UPI0022B57824|nr:hypothetical protein [Chitinimonas sp. BJYL2]
MTTKNIAYADLLKYIQLQLAAEALFGRDAVESPGREPGDLFNGAIATSVLEKGNRHASKFTKTQAEQFASQWTVVEHISNTTTGFSGTLFKNKTANEPAAIPLQHVAAATLDYPLAFVRVTAQ